MKNVIAIGGSNSEKSINKTLAAYAANKVTDAKVTVLDLNDFALPIYGVDLETKDGIPDEASRLNSLLMATDGLVISLAEHNGSYSTAFKNAFDWLSRIDPKVWKNKPMLLMATSPGGRGGMSVLASAKMTFPHMGGNIIADFSLPLFYDNFSETGLKDEKLNADLNSKIKVLQVAL